MNETPEQSSSDSVVRARGLVKRYGDNNVVAGIDLDITRGRCFGLLGPNGAGKTTTLRMMLGLTPKTAGELTVLGHSMPEHARVVRQRVGIVPQADNLDPDFSVRENLRIYASYFGLPAKVVAERIDELLEMVELTDRADENIRKLSGGMVRRLSIARALVNNPELVILDEPTTGLDPQVRHRVWTLLRALKQAGKTLILTSHYMEEAERLCDELVIIDHGQIISHGSPDALVREHVETDVIEFPANQGKDVRAALGDGRAELVGDLLYVYTNNPRELLDPLEEVPGMRYLHRPANLEDVFIRMTGRDLRQ